MREIVSISKRNVSIKMIEWDNCEMFTSVESMTTEYIVYFMVVLYGTYYFKFTKLWGQRHRGSNAPSIMFMFIS